MATLTEVLAARDARAALQRALLAAHPTLTLVQLTVVAPGAEKRTAQTLAVAQAAREALARGAADGGIPAAVPPQVRDLCTGYELLLLTALGEDEAKRRAMRIEDTHPLGRLMDIDVISRRAGRPLSRADFGAPARPCLLCGGDARLCMRSRSHTTAELLRKMQEMVAAYQARA